MKLTARTQLVLHPYYKLAYIKLAWGGEKKKEQADERDAGNQYAKNWQDEAMKVVEREVSNFFRIISIESTINWFQMEKYWKQAPPTVLPTDVTSGNNAGSSASVLSDYDRYRLTLLSTTECDGWEAELRRYLKDMPADVSRRLIL
jgi:hypothetical protein